VESGPFEGRLLPRERILWSGAPAQGLLLTSRDIFLIPFSLVWCGFVVFWLYSASQGRAPLFFHLWGAMFLCIGLFFAVGRFAFDAWLRRRTAYAVTDTRVLILRAAPFSSFTSLSVERMADVQIANEQGNRGTLRFGPATALFSNRSFAVWMPALDPTPQFLAIEGARGVFDLVVRVGSEGRAA